jgi:O-acetyl-ADP-ribose deacetylase
LNKQYLYKINEQVTLECLEGDITEQEDIDVIVNAANAQLMPGGGVAGAIHARAGPALAAECEALAPIKPGQAVITGAHGLSNKYVIHCLGPIYGIDKPEQKLLASCYRSALNLAETFRVTSIAFPAISTGIFGYPLREASQISLSTVRDFNAYNALKLVRFVLWRAEDVKLFSQVMGETFTK